MSNRSKCSRTRLLPDTRRLCYAAHEEFKKLYPSELMIKRKAYQWLPMTV